MRDFIMFVMAIYIAWQMVVIEGHMRRADYSLYVIGKFLNGNLVCLDDEGGRICHRLKLGAEQ